jgi:regulator of sigma E protease
MGLTGYWSLIYQIPVGLLGLSFMVFIHELGHFAVAKWAGVKVHTFSIGFGKKLIRWKKGDTEYCLSAIPFGGYVAMSGESPDDGGYGNSDEFREKPILVRAAIAVAGPLANIVFAIGILFVLYQIGVEEPKYAMVIGEIEKGGAGEKAGFKPGDEILTLQGAPVKSWETFWQDAALQGGKSLTVHIKRDGQEMDLTLVPEMDDRFGIAQVGLIGEMKVVITKVVEGTPAAAAGILAGDTLLRIDSTRIPSASALVEMVNGSKGRDISVTVKRADGEKSFTLAPKMDESDKRFKMGVYPGHVVPVQLNKYGPAEAFQKSVGKNYEYATMVFKTFASILTGRIHLKALSGPVGIIQMIAGSLRQGMQKFLEFIALLNTNLGVLNLLPLAITDGGLLLFLLVEAIRRKPLSLRVQGIVNRVGLSFFLALFLFVTFQDILRIPWFLN